MDLLNRALLRLDGADALAFLQKLVTQDLAQLPAYTLLLSPQGRYVFDFFVVQEHGAVFVDVAAHQAEELAATLNKYKLRSDVTISRVAPASVEIILQRGAAPALLAFADPRHESLGWRVWRARERFSDAAPPADYKIILTRLGMAEPAHELRPNHDLPLEFGLQHANAISFTKGCFLGQELTARTHHKHLIKHIILVVDAALMLAADTPVHDADGAVIGRVHRAAPPFAMVQVKAREGGYATVVIAGTPHTVLASC
jgi:folate-binding protein YgfZ